MRTCDLHTHSIYSDGTFSPKEIIDSAVNIGLEAVALCDHNTVDGLPYFLEAAKDKNIKAIAGAEFSVDYNGVELHLLGLFIPESAFGTVSELMEDVNAKKRQSNIDLITSLNRAGYEIDYEEVKRLTPDGKFNRAHIAEVLTRKGYTESIKQAFDTLLSKGSGHYKEPQRINFLDMVGFIRQIGAVPILAHPFLNLNKDELEALLPSAKSHGLIGVECYSSTYTAEQTSASFELAKRFSLKISGGSDFHGSRKPDIMLGTGKGNLKIPYDLAIELERCKQ